MSDEKNNGGDKPVIDGTVTEKKTESAASAPGAESPNTETPKAETPKPEAGAATGTPEVKPGEQAAVTKLTAEEAAKGGKNWNLFEDDATKQIAENRAKLKNKDLPQAERDELIKKTDKLIEDATKGKHEQFSKNLTAWGRARAGFAANFSEHSTTGSKIFRGTAAAGTIAYAGKKGYDLIAPERDEQGERKESAWVSAGKAAAALAVAATALLMGGKNKALGLTRG